MLKEEVTVSEEFINKILSFGDVWDFQHDEIFLKNYVLKKLVITEQDEYEKNFQALLLEIFEMARKIKDKYNA